MQVWEIPFFMPKSYVMKILMVCLGNICRSPLAEGILKSKLSNYFEIDSAGTIAMHQGKLPDSRSISTAREHGIDITDQRSRPITKSDLDSFDLIFCMDEENYFNVLNLADSEIQKSKVHLILEFAGMGRNEVPDPYYGGISGFEKVYGMLDEAADKIAAKLQTSAS